MLSIDRQGFWLFFREASWTCILQDWVDNSLVNMHKALGNDSSSLMTLVHFSFFRNQSYLAAFDVIAAT